MKNGKQGKPLSTLDNQIFVTLGEFAYHIIEEQFDRIVKQKKHVLADHDPEHLHQMRVGTRRLRTALQVFDSVAKVPKAASANRLRDLARTLGAVRDLDVQMASLKDEYCPNLNHNEQKKLNKVLKSLKKQRKKAFAKLEAALTKHQYRDLKKAYKNWLQCPAYTDVAQLSMLSLLPDLLSPLLSELLLHPGWLIATHQISDENADILHDLRKVCKHVRYQAEFFTPFYGEEFRNWIKEIKQLQDDLGALQDTQVLKDLMEQELGKKSSMPGLNALVHQKQTDVLSHWDEIRQNYLDQQFRYRLHRMLLNPLNYQPQIHPELIPSEPIAFSGVEKT